MLGFGNYQLILVLFFLEISSTTTRNLPKSRIWPVPCNEVAPSIQLPPRPPLPDGRRVSPRVHAGLRSDGHIRRAGLPRPLHAVQVRAGSLLCLVRLLDRPAQQGRPIRIVSTALLANELRHFKTSPNFQPPEEPLFPVNLHLLL